MITVGSLSLDTGKKNDCNSFLALSDDFSCLLIINPKGGTLQTVKIRPSRS